jgi:hypothetical protein
VAPEQIRGDDVDFGAGTRGCKLPSSTKISGNEAILEVAV